MFRPTFFAVFLATSPVWAADFQVQAPVLAAKVYPQGASLTRAILIDLPIGTHRVLLPIAPGMDFETPPQIGGLGDLTVGAIEVLPAYVADAETVYSDEQKRARARLDEAEAALRAAQDILATAQAAVLAAELRIEFLGSVKAGGDGALTAAELRDISVMLGEETIIARAAFQTAIEDARLSEQAVEDARKTLDQATQDLARLRPPEGLVDMLAITLNVPQPVSANLTLNHLVYAASWRPTYAMNLDRAEGLIDIERKAIVSQQTGETWSGIALSLSTADPFAQTEPNAVNPNRAHISKAQERSYETSARTLKVEQSAQADFGVAVVAEEVARLEIEGESTRYDYPQPVSISPGGGLLSLSLDQVLVDADVINRAAPRFDQTAFTIAKISNTLDEPLLSGSVSLSRDGVYVGQSQMRLIPVGSEAEISFGPVEGIRLGYKLLDNNTGDRGILTSSNTRNQEMEFTVENLTDETTSVEALFALPFSEQEDLELGVVARPAADDLSLSEGRGVGRWDMELSPGEAQTVRIRAGFTWPDGFELNWRP